MPAWRRLCFPFPSSRPRAISSRQTIGSNTIFKFTPDGTESTFASGLNGPFGLAFDSSGNVFEGDFGSNTIFKFTPDGTKSTFASGLSGPIGLAFDSSGNLFEADYYSGTIFKFTPAGTKSTFASGLSQPCRPGL